MEKVGIRKKKERKTNGKSRNKEKERKTDRWKE